MAPRPCRRPSRPLQPSGLACRSAARHARRAHVVSARARARSSRRTTSPSVTSRDVAGKPAIVVQSHAKVSGLGELAASVAASTSTTRSRRGSTSRPAGRCAGTVDEFATKATDKERTEAQLSERTGNTVPIEFHINDDPANARAADGLVARDVGLQRVHGRAALVGSARRARACRRRGAAQPLPLARRHEDRRRRGGCTPRSATSRRCASTATPTSCRATTRSPRATTSATSRSGSPTTAAACRSRSSRRPTTVTSR